MDTFAQPLGTSINQVCVVGGERGMGVSWGWGGGELGVTILAQKCEGECGKLGVRILTQKCEWVTHTLRASHPPPLGVPRGDLGGARGDLVSIGRLDSQWCQGVWPVAYLCLQQVRKGWTGGSRGSDWLGPGWG